MSPVSRAITHRQSAPTPAHRTRPTFTTPALWKPAGHSSASGGGRWTGRVGGISTRFVSNEACNRPYRHRTSRHRQAAYRPRDVAKQCETTRTSDQPEPQVTARFGAFAQVSGSGLSDLGDRRSGVQISPARPPEVSLPSWLHPGAESHTLPVALDPRRLLCPPRRVSRLEPLRIDRSRR